MKNKFIKILNKNLWLYLPVFFMSQAGFSTSTNSNKQNSQIHLPKTEVLNNSKTKSAEQQKTKREAEPTAKAEIQEKKKNLTEPIEVPNTTDNFSSYSFRPLLIQGKKRMAQKSKDMRVETGNIAESKLFFIDIDFKKRIFEDELPGPEQ